MTQPAHARDRARERDRRRRCAPAACPRPSISGAMRRLASPQGLLARRAGPSAAPIDCSPPSTASRDDAAAGRAERDGRHDGGLGRALAAVDTRARAVGRRGCASSCSSGSRPRRRCSSARRPRIGAPAGTWTRPDPLAPVAHRPALRRADVRRAAAGRAVAVPARASSSVEADGVALLETSPRVIEAYMAGPQPRAQPRAAVARVPGRARPARRSASSGTSAASPATRGAGDIPPLSEWGEAPLGTHLRGGDRPARAARPRRAAAPLPDDHDLRRRARRPTARSTRRPGWRRCSAARSRRTSCSSASR